MKRNLTAFLLSIGIVVGAVDLFQAKHVWAGLSQAPAQERFDRYGGLLSAPCTNRTGHFIFTKLGNRWWYCSPAGHVFIAMSVGNILPNGNPTLDCKGTNTYPIYITKYGDTTYNWGWQTLKRMTSWGFNSVGQDSGPNVMPFRTCPNCSWPSGKQPVPLPYLSESKPAEYASINIFDYLEEPIKDEVSGTNDHYRTWRGGALYDVFDPKLNEEWQKELARTSNPGIQNLRNNNPYLLGVFTDDSDYFWGSGAGPDFATGHTNANVAWVTLITSPVQTFIQTTPFEGKRFLYQTTQIYSKTLASNPSAPCSISNPCSLRDYLWQKYKGDISSLDKAWGANYTSFDSTGQQIRGEVVGTGDGAKRVFTFRLSRFPVSPFSILISVDGIARAGDCPWFHYACGERKKDQGTIDSPTADYIVQQSSDINYSNGAITLTFVVPPSVGAHITLDYVHGGWMAGGTGLMDEDGSHAGWVGTNPFCLEGTDQEYPKYFACVAGGGKHDPVPDANPTVARDLDNWVPQMAAKYFKTMHDGLKAVSKIPYLGLDVLGSWGGPAYSKFLEGAAPYLDGAFIGGLNETLSESTDNFRSKYDYLTRYLGDIPFQTFNVIMAENDSSMSCHPVPNTEPTQEARGQAWYNSVRFLLTTPSFNGDYPFVGADWWSWQDFQNSNQGLVSIHDNAYDGHEDVSRTVPCSIPLENLICGGEISNYGNAIDKIRQANSLWHSALP